MRNSNYRWSALTLAGICLWPAGCHADEQDPSPWRKEIVAPRQAGIAIDPLVFARIKATGNDEAPRFAVDRDAALISAAAQNDLLGVDTLLKKGANANAQDALGNRPLPHAARLGAVEMVRMLLEAGADPDVKGMGFTPLGIAALNGQLQVTALLLKAGARADLRSDNGLTPLMNAGLMNHVRIMELILRYDTDVDRENGAGRTALSYAAEGGAEQALVLLLARGADVNALDHKYNTALYWAALGEQQSAVRLLLRHGATAGALALDLL